MIDSYEKALPPPPPKKGHSAPWVFPESDNTVSFTSPGIAYGTGKNLGHTSNDIQEFELVYSPCRKHVIPTGVSDGKLIGLFRKPPHNQYDSFFLFSLNF